MSGGNQSRRAGAPDVGGTMHSKILRKKRGKCEVNMGKETGGGGDNSE